MVKFYEKNLPHIFRNAPGHLTGTPENRRIIIETASNSEYLIGKDRFGNMRYARNIEGVGQIWVHVHKGDIRNGGINNPPRSVPELMGNYGKVSSNEKSD